MQKKVFLDGASNTPLDKRVFRAMKPYMKESFVGNSHSIHDFGIKANLAIEDARDKVASALGVYSDEVIFTSGATESNNTVIQSLCIEELRKAHLGEKAKLHVLCSAIEHDSVYLVCKRMAELGMDVEFVQPNKNGVITVHEIKDKLRPDTLLVCVMDANNETGALNDTFKITRMVKKNKSLSLIDITQSLSVGGDAMNVGKLYPSGDFFTFSAHKIYGPTGVGCLIARRDVQKNIHPFIIGGEQENGLRAGTSNTAGIVGLGAAVDYLRSECHLDHYKQLTLYLLSKCNKYGKVNVPLNKIKTYYNIISLNCAEWIDTNNLAAELSLNGVAVSVGSACDIGKEFHGSHVLSALGLDEKGMRNTIRISFTKYTRYKDIDRLAESLELIRIENQRQQIAVQKLSKLFKE